RRRAYEAKIVDAVGQGKIGMRVDVVNAPVALHLVDEGKMSVRIVDHRSGLDRLRFDGRRIEIGFLRLFEGGMDAIRRRGDVIADRVENGVAGRARVARVFAFDDGVSSRGIADVVRVAARLDAARISEGQSAFPGVVEAQIVGQVGAIGTKLD